jgi:hypothetical protein
MSLVNRHITPPPDLPRRRSLGAAPAATLLVTLSLALALAGGCTDGSAPEGPPMPPAEIGPLTQASPESCGRCHIQHHAEWQRSMHAYAGRDPVWFALMEAGQRDTGGMLGDFCVFCHVPAASLAGEIEPLVPGQAPAAVDHGVHCGFCHTVSDHDGISNQAFTFEMATDDVVYGTMIDPLPTDAHRSELRAELGDSDFCGTCHELENDHGTVIESTYTEWLTSAFTAMGIECQDCHMPTYRGRATPDGPERTLHRHTFVGVDVALEDVPYRDQQIRDVEALLDGVARVELSGLVRDDSAHVVVRVDNLGTGHALPSGPTMERQLWIELTVTDATGGTIFRSGDLDARGDLRDHHSSLDPTDAQLAIFNTVLIDEHGEETPFMWRAVRTESRLIPAFGSRTARYAIELGPGAALPLDVQARLRFRALPPYVLRALELGELTGYLPVFDMAEASLIVTAEE